MRRATSIGLIAISALAAAAVAHAAGVTVNSVVTGGSTLSVASLNTPSVPFTLTGDDQTGSYQAQLQVVDARGLITGGGWNLTLQATTFSDGSGHSLPTPTITTVTAGCHTATSTCTLPTNNASNTGIAMPIASAAKILNAATATGLGRIDVNVNVSVSVPGNTFAASYSTTLTFAIVNGP